MAVFTVVTDDQLGNWLQRYDVGQLGESRGIAQGIENTNYFVDTERGSYVLTLIERIGADDLPFYLGLMKHLARHGIPCPEPLSDAEGGLWSWLNGKPATLVTRLPGTQVAHPEVSHCAAVGSLLARMHLAARDFPLALPNPRGSHWWPVAFSAIGKELDAGQSEVIARELREQRDFAVTQAYLALPSSAVHADCFRDNVLFDAVAGPGVIDFYFACNDTWVYDLAVTCNDWCVDDEGELNAERTSALLDGYQTVRPLQTVERDAWPMLLRAAALRFWLSRLYDHFLPRDAEVLSPKDPRWFERILHARKSGRTEII